MRRFQQDHFPTDAATALNSKHFLTITTETADEALDYVNQFIIGPEHSKTLLRGYLPETYVDALVELRDENSNRDLNSAIARLCVDGDASTPVEDTIEFSTLSIEPTERAHERKLEARKNVTASETKQNLATLGDLILHNKHRNQIRMYLPTDSLDELHTTNLL